MLIVSKSVVSCAHVTADIDAAVESVAASDEPVKVSNEWWAEYVKSEDQFNTELSGKLMILSEILRMCELIGDKV